MLNDSRSILCMLSGLWYRSTPLVFIKGYVLLKGRGKGRLWSEYNHSGIVPPQLSHVENVESRLQIGT